MDEKFIGNRITFLRMKKDISEYRMSLELGQSKSYVQGISSGKALPSMKQLLNICDYFNISPAEFFDDEMDNPQQIHEFISLLKQLTPEDANRIMDLAKRLLELYSTK